MQVARLGSVLVIATCIALLQACAVQRARRDIPGADLSAIHSDVPRADIEARLGPPDRQWSTSAGVTYRRYRYYAGAPGNKSAAGALVLGEIATLGLLDLIEKGDPHAPDLDPRHWRWLAVAYDDRDIALGVFLDIGDFTVLPDDGRPRAPGNRPPP